MVVRESVVRRTTSLRRMKRIEVLGSGASARKASASVPRWNERHTRANALTRARSASLTRPSSRGKRITSSQAVRKKPL
jgi:hypothetical protein